MRSLRKQMDIVHLSDIASSDEAAREYLLGLCLEDNPRDCPRCSTQKLYHVAGGRYRCSQCRYTFHDFSLRFINGCALTPKQWLWFIKLFELNVPPQDIGRQMKLSYPTVLKVQDTIRRAILAQTLDAKTVYATGIWPGPGRDKPSKHLEDSPVFGVIEVDGYIFCDCLPEITPEALIHFKQNFRLRTGSVGGIVYTGPYQHYQTLAACGPGYWPSSLVQHDAPWLQADTTTFWTYAKFRFKQLRGVQPALFPLYLKELEFKYNHRDKALFPALVKAVCARVPDG